MTDLTEAQRRILDFAANAEDSRYPVPWPNFRQGSGDERVCLTLMKEGLMERAASSYPSYEITPAGRAALDAGR